MKFRLEEKFNDYYDTLVEEFTDYNANPMDKNEGDCAIRALSLAYDLNYNQVRNELHSLGGKNKEQFNAIDVINAFIEKHGYKDHYNNERDSDSSIGTVQEFAKKYHNGIYVINCSNNIKQNTSNSFHLVTIINGEIYDTWDSSDYYVLGAWKINNNPQRLIKKVNDKNGEK